MSTETIAPIVTALTTRLFEAEERRLGAIISSLNKRNKGMAEVKLDGFLYLGIFYLPKDATLRSVGPVAKTALCGSLYGEMESFLQDKKQVLDEQKLIKQILFTLLRPCRNNQNFRDALPECLVNCLPDLARLLRQEETAWTIRDNPRALRQYEKFLPRMELYSAAKLLY